MLPHKTFTKQDYIPKSQRKQSLFQTNKNKLTLLESFIELYYSTLDFNNFTEVHIPPEVKPVADLLYERYGYPTSLVIPDKTLQYQDFPENPDAVIHLVTAGKDSTAMAKKEEPHYKHNLLVHFVGVNKIYPIEHRQCKQLYTKQYFPTSEYHEIKVELPQVKNQSESPIKNGLITILSIEYFGFVPAMISIGGSSGVSDISETEVFGDSSKGWNPIFNLIKEVYNTKEFKTTPWLRDQIEPYEILTQNNIPFSLLGSCMSQERFKKLQRQRIITKYTKTVEGHHLLAGTTKDTNKSIFDLTQDQINKLTLQDLTHTQEILEDDYRCGVCFKCNEFTLIMSRHLGYNFHPDYIKDAERLLIQWMDKSPNRNGVNLWKYYTDFLGIPKERIPQKYHKYLSGEAVNPQ